MSKKTSTIDQPTILELYRDNDLCAAIAGHMHYHDPDRAGYRFNHLYSCHYDGVGASGNDTREVVKLIIRKLRKAKRV